MKKMFIVVLMGIFFISPVTAWASEKVSQKLIDFTHSTLVKFGTDSVIVEAVKAENSQKKSLEKIKALDERWRATPGLADYMKDIMDSKCGKHLRSIQQTTSFYAEIFVMDNQGANVAMTEKTTDYWQGDEAKFIKCYNEGKGGMYFSDVEFDDSTQAYVVHISVPVKAHNKVIGAVTIGVDVDKFEE